MLADARARNTSYLPTYPLTEPRRGPRGGLCEKIVEDYSTLSSLHVSHLETKSKKKENGQIPRKSVHAHYKRKERRLEM